MKLGGPFRLILMMVVGLLFISTSQAIGAEFYYVLIFGSQTSPKQLRTSHTWATFVKATGEGTDPDNYAIEAHTISWVPQSLDVKVWTLRPEKAMNLSLEQTLQWVYANRESVNLWGPFQVTPLIWNRSLEVRQTLASGSVQYRAISGPMDLLISDCIHAVAAVDPQFGRGHYPLIRVGKAASRYIARQVMRRGELRESTTDNSWLVDRLGLRSYPILVIPPEQVSHPNGKGVRNRLELNGS